MPHCHERAVWPFERKYYNCKSTPFPYAAQSESAIHTSLLSACALQEYDGAEPAASSIAAANLFRLAALSSSEAGQR